MTITKTRAAFVFKILLLPLIVTAVVGADSLARNLLNNAKSFVQEDGGLQETLSSHFIRLDEGNAFGGVIRGIDESTGDTIGIPELEVYLVQKSKVRHESKTNVDGEFEFEGIDPGTYSFCVAGTNGFLAHGIHFVEPSPEPADQAPAAEGADDQANLGVDESLEIQTSWPVAPMQITAAVVPPEFTALREIMSDLLPGAVASTVGAGGDNIKINVEKSVISAGFKISLGDDGSMKGRIAPIGVEKGKPVRINEMNVFLIENDEIYSRATVESDGTFEFLDVEPGVYGFAAAGKDGFAALSFQAVVPEIDTLAADRDTHFTSSRFERVSNELEVAICPPEDSPFMKDKINELTGDPPERPDVPDDGGVDTPIDPAQPISFQNGAFDGGFDEGGSQGGGFNGTGSTRNRRFLRWALIGGLIGGIIAVSVDGDDTAAVTPQPVSPAN